MPSNLLSERSATVKQIAAELGFDDCGIAEATFLEEDAYRLERWLIKGFNGKMGYMEKHFDLRTDPRKLVPGAKSVITLLINYFPDEKQRPDAPGIAKYAYGKDYHLVIREMLNEFLFRLRDEFGEINGRGFVDSAPVLERTWAVKSGLGWVGKNGNLIRKGSGSFFFIASLITDLETQADTAFQADLCGTCTRCIDACPTDAILPNKEIKADQCISYFTIELKDLLLPEESKNKMGNWMFGCDVCQDVCPWNRFSSPHKNVSLKPINEILNYSENDWKELTQFSFNEIFRDSPLKRTKYTGIMRNLDFIKTTHEA